MGPRSDALEGRPVWADAVDESLRRHATDAGPLLPVLHGVQDRIGYIPAEAVPRIADALNLSHAEVHGVISFYHDFRAAKPGRHVLKVCRAEACQAMGSEALAEELTLRLGVGFGETSRDGKVSIDPVYCLGNCALSPSAMLDGRLVGRCTADSLVELLTRAEAS